jgi:Domain of unknown function (DUF4397)
MKIKMQCAVALLVVLGSALIVNSANAQTASVYVAHAASGRSVSSTGSPEMPVDFMVSSNPDLSNGTCIAKGVTFGQIAGPWSWPAGPYWIQWTAANTVTPCSGAPVYTSSILVAAGSTYIGVLTLDASNNVVGQLYTPDLSSIPPGSGRIEVANASLDTLNASISGTNGTNTAVNAPGNILEATVPGGLYTSTILTQSNQVLVGPVAVQIETRNWYFYVVAGSTATNSVQLIGPKLIRGVY